MLFYKNRKGLLVYFLIIYYKFKSKSIKTDQIISKIN